MIYQFYIELEESNPLVWRRIVVPANYNLYQLHMALQGAFGWENSHLFQFCEKDLSDPIGYGIPDDFDSDTEIFDAKKTKMIKVFKTLGQQYYYIYDFGDYWRHLIRCEKIEAKDIGSPYCLGGEGTCPPEDVGGMHGYHEMLQVFDKPGSKEKNEYRKWLCLVEGEKWDAHFCSIREVNKRLCLLG
ncbi:plasmid pRiA4b ORF-3 family protein [Flavitalea flava]